MSDLSVPSKSRPTATEREARYRELPDPDLLSELEHGVPQLANVLDVAADTDQEAAVPWTGRTMKVAWFGEHMRRMDLAPPAGRAVVESDPAARLLLLWGRRPADPGRLRSDAGPERLGRVRRLLCGY
jgi:hypothetical protein